MSSDTQAILDLLGDLPPGANPYEVVRKYALQALNPPLPESHRRQLIAIAVIFSFSLFFIVASLVVRILNGSFWIVHWGDSPRLLRPLFSVSWSLWAVVFLVLIEVVVIDSIKQFQRASIQKDYAAWRTLAWLPAVYGGWTAAWGTLVSYLLHLHAYGRARLVDRLAPWVNASSILVPVIFSLVFIPLAAIGADRFRWTMDTFYAIDHLLRQLAAAYHGENALLELLSSGLPLLQELEKRTNVFLYWWMVTLSAAAAFGFFLVAMLVTVASLYLVALRHVLRLSTWQTESGSTRTSSLQPLRRTYANMDINLCIFSILGLTTSTTVVVMAAVPRGFVDPTFAQIFVLLPFYAFAILGLPSSVLLFVRAFDAKRESSRSHTRISVNVNVVSFTEGFELVDRGAAPAHRLERSAGSVHVADHHLYPSLEVRASNSSLDKDVRPFDEYAHFPPEPTATTLGAARPDSVYSVGSLEVGGRIDVGARPDLFGAATLEGTAGLSLDAAAPARGGGCVRG
ncbi:uncharacterized protein RHOBADRAFT_53192 [Rhodotorula graminis WP1]|uniref:Uncharacterized protein n=1 Tax=Rhodotorula graminis (strain WP1) TaxID=578459 RepID=A0A194S3S9_RHOGW|nr:uncharacterized protein RHOBADRAFT_53192 [Rhodotorula graminis WP1]KPV75179.1 hypothetical protein RHOBADRAFT_53192 [Rhodotorula graminis WP1]